MKHTNISKVSLPPYLIRGKQLIAFFLSVLMLLTVLPTTVYAASVGSISTDKSVGEDTMQNASTTYKNVEPGSAGTDVYLTVDNGTIVVGVPTVVILSGSPNENGEYTGDYSVYAEGDISGDEVLNIYPETDTVTMMQSGKENKSASVSQTKTEFLSEDIVDGMTTTGDISAEGLTAGSWNGNFNFVISMISRAVYYSSLERAIADANNLTTENADVKREDVENAVAALYIQDSTAYIRMMNNENNVQSMTATSNTIIDLNGHTVTFAQGQYLTYNKNLSVLDGVINAVDSNYIISGSSTNTASTLSLRDLSLNETVTENIKTHAYQVNSYSLNNNLDNVEINTTGNGNSSHGVYGINFRNGNSVNEVNNYSFISDVVNPLKIRGTQANGSTTFNEPVVDIQTNAKGVIGLYIGEGATKTVMNDSKINVISYSTDSDDAIVGIGSYSNIVEINGCDVYCDAPNATKGSGIVLVTTERTTINSTLENPVTVYGKQWGINTSDYGSTMINGGIYTSTNHTGYICGNADIHDAEFYIVNRDKYTVVDAAYGLYCGGLNTSGDAVVNFYNCKINNGVQKSGFTITAKRNGGYKSPRDINFYDCDLYRNDTLFSYNHISADNIGNTRFNLYGNTKLYDYNGQEISKITLANAINTWKSTPRVNMSVSDKKYHTDLIGNGYIGGFVANVNENTGEIYEVYLTDDANVYDYR